MSLQGNVGQATGYCGRTHERSLADDMSGSHGHGDVR